MRMNWSYAAGFVDGEGSFVKIGKSDYRILIPQTNEEVLKQIQAFAGVGRIFRVTRRKSHWKDSWVYFVARQEDVLHFLRSVSPFLVVKKELAGETVRAVRRIVLMNREKKLHLQRTKRACKLLRERGLSYRAIGKRLDIDHGYVRRLILFDGKK